MLDQSFLTRDACGLLGWCRLVSLIAVCAECQVAKATITVNRFGTSQPDIAGRIHADWQWPDRSSPWYRTN